MDTEWGIMEPNIWKENFNIRSYEVDCMGRLTIVSIFNLMQEAQLHGQLSLSINYQIYLENQALLLTLRDDVATVKSEGKPYNRSTTQRPNSS